MQKGAKIVAGCRIVIIAGLGCIALSGCGEDEIHSYKAPKSQSPPTVSAEQQLPAGHPPIPGAAAADSHDHPAQRLLAAITTHGDRTWFFKLVGPFDAVSNQADTFADFIQSFQFPADTTQPLQWKLPEGWRQLPPANAMRYATLQIGAGPNPLEVSVFAFGGEAGGMLSNINRWRGQMQLPPIAEGDLAKETRTVDQGGHKITIVEMVGGGSGKMTPPFAGGNAPAAPTAPAPPPLLARPDVTPLAPGPVKPNAPPVAPAADDAKLSYDTPQGWQLLPPTGPRLLSFSAGETQVAVTKFGGDVGGMLANVNRWRSQVGLSPIDESGLKDAVQPIDVGPLKGNLVELYGPDGDKRPGLLAVSVQRDGMTWFFKMAGPAAAVQQQKDGFERFVRSVKFASPGASDGK